MRKRIVTGLILLAIGILVIGMGGWAMWIWVWLLSMASVYELVGMLSKLSIGTYPAVAYTSITAGLLSLQVVPTWWTSWAGRLLAFGVVGGCLFELVKRSIWLPKSKILATLRIILFILGTFPFIYLLRMGQDGLFLFVLTMMSIWTTDTFALIGGRLWGRHPLSEISPNKTVEGTMIGVLSGTLMACLVWGVAFQLGGHVGPWWFYGMLGVWVSMMSQVGDLHESLFKRRIGVKDSSHLLPGHGGVYDRADSTLLVVPLAWHLFNP